MSSNNGMPAGEFYANLLGPPTSVSQHGPATELSSEIAQGVPMSIFVRPSSSVGTAMDALIDNVSIRHVEGTPKLK